MDNGPLHERFSELSTPLVADAFLRLSVPLRIAPPGIRPVVAGLRLAGRVLPARHYGSVDVFLEALELGTCAGFQHIVLEYARNVMGIADAAHQEYDPEAGTLLLTALACPVAHQTLKINLLPESFPARVYGRTEIEEYYYCNFGINPAFQRDVDEGGLRVVGRDQDDEPRVLQLPGHRFYVATLFVPGASYTEGVVEMEGAHPLVKALLLAGIAFREERAARAEAQLAAR